MGEGFLVSTGGEVKDKGSVLVERMVWGQGCLSFLHWEALCLVHLQ